MDHFKHFHYLPLFPLVLVESDSETVSVLILGLVDDQGVEADPLEHLDRNSEVDHPSLRPLINPEHELPRIESVAEPVDRFHSSLNDQKG